MPGDRRVLLISSIGCGPPFHGNRVRQRSLISEIRALGYEVDFAGVAMSDEERTATLPHVNRWVADFTETDSLGVPGRIKRKLRHLGVRAGLVGRPDEKERKTALDRWFREEWKDKARTLQKTGNYHRVIVSYVFHSAFLEFFPDSCVKILDTHDVFTDRDKRMEALGLGPDSYWFSVPEASERRALMRANVIMGIQNRETAFFQKLTAGERTVRTVGHFVETKQLPFPEDVGAVIGYLASDNVLNVQGTRWFLNEVWPLVIGAVPDARLVVGGGICSEVEWPENVTVLGRVDSIEDVYRRCTFTINPMQGGTGLKIKTVESLAFGRAVVSTPTGADGVEHCVGRGLTVGNNPREFADAVILWLRNPGLAMSKGTEAISAMTESNVQSNEQLKLSLENGLHG